MMGWSLGFLRGFAMWSSRPSKPEQARTECRQIPTLSTPSMCASKTLPCASQPPARFRHTKTTRSLPGSDKNKADLELTGQH